MSVYDIAGNKIVKDDNSFKEQMFWKNQNNAYYWIFHLDCARKYFTVANIKTIIELIANAGFNQMQLHFSENEGFRLMLDDMLIKVGANEYNIAPCIGGTESPNLYYTQSNMDEIINYAHQHGVDIVPSFDSPGHMGRILDVFPQFKYGNTKTIDVTNQTAVSFATGLVDLYSKYFASRKCTWFNLGVDEIGGENGFNTFYENGKYNYIANYINTLCELIKSNGCIPRAFNEGFYFANDQSYAFNRDINVLYWRGKASTFPGSRVATAEELIDKGYVVINSAYKYYWVNNNPNVQVNAETLRSANLLRDFQKDSSAKDGNGAMFCVWCDYSSSAPDNGDGGNTVVTSITPLISAFGDGIAHTLSLQGSQNQS